MKVYKYSSSKSDENLCMFKSSLLGTSVAAWISEFAVCLLN